MIWGKHWASFVCVWCCYFLKLKLASRRQVNSNLAKRVMMRKQPFWVGAQEFCSMTTPLAPRVWPFSKDLNLGSPLQFPLCFPQDTFKSNNLELSPLKISDHCARCLLLSSISCSLLTWDRGLPFLQLIAPLFWDLYVINLVSFLPLCKCSDTVPRIKMALGFPFPKMGALTLREPPGATNISSLSRSSSEYY